MKFSYFEAFLTSFVVGLAENYFAPFALHLGGSTLQSGLLLSLPLVFAALGQFLLQPYFSHLRVSEFVQKTTLFQSVTLLLLAGLSLIPQFASFPLLLVLFSVYWLGHFSTQPAWNRWVSEIIPMERGQKYFSMRTRLSQIGIIAGLLVGGATLHLHIIDISSSALFCGLFLISFFCKIGAYYYFTKHQHIDVALNVSRRKMLASFQQHLDFFKSYSLFNFSLYISATFVAGYLLSHRKVSYLDFMWIMMALFVGKMITTFILKLKRTENRYSPQELMFYGGLIAAPLPALWPLCSEIWMMCLVHLFSGLAWAAWEVGLSLCFFKSLEPQEKMETISVYNYIGVTTQILGTLTGGFIVKFFLKENYDILFVIAGVFRFLCVLPLRKNTLNAGPKIDPTSVSKTTSKGALSKAA